MPHGFQRLYISAKQHITLDDGPDVGPRCYARVIDDDSMTANPSNGLDNFRPGDVVVFDHDFTL